MTYSKDDLIHAILNEADFMSTLHPSVASVLPSEEELERMSMEELLDVALVDPTCTVEDYLDTYGSWYDENIRKNS